jgi:succinate dehydrogenase / fumarate reductase cytochrome b subunit
MTAKINVKPARPSRPLSPHLQVYKPQLTSGLSIFHRITGIGLAFGLPVLVGWLIVLAGPPDLYEQFISLFQTLIGQILLAAWTFAFFYHFCCGIRHLLWDAGYFLDIKSVYVTGYIVLAVSILATAAIWLKAYGVLP